jgi:pyruvate formate lyase activating enzyme
LTWNLTQVEPREVAADVMEAERIVKSARELNCRGIVYTHSEPTLNLEYYLEIMKLARKEGIVNAFATNGLISPEGLDIISDYLDAIALTVKGTEGFYGKICGFRVRKSDLMRAVEDIREREIHLELVYVLIPGFNDDEASLKETVEFARAGRSPLIFLRFFPSYKMDNLNSTPEEVLEKAVNFAYNQGVKYVYLENIYAHPAKNTYCGECRRLLIKREGYGIVEWNLNEKRCPTCGARAPIVGEPFL